MPVSNKNLIDSYIQGIAQKDPQLYQILRMMSDNFGVLLEDLRPILNPPAISSGSDLDVPEPMQEMSYTILPTGVLISWTPPEDDSDVAFYEIRKGNIADWNGAERITKTASRNVFLSPLTVGVHTYLGKTINRDGNASQDLESVTINITAPESVSVSSQCIDNNVLLTWTIPNSQFRIDYYIISKDGSEYGRASATFTNIFENSAGTYQYGVKAVDIAGNIGPESFINVEVRQPPDYTLVSRHNSDFSGTKSHCALIGDLLFAILDLTETWETHFTDNSFDTIQDQLDLGYDYFLQPSNTSGYYEEVIDFGAIYTNVIVNLDWDFIEIDGNVIISGQIEVSDDGSSWSAPVVGVSLFASSCRYARVRMAFSSDDKALVAISQFSVSLDVKQETDSGNINALAADADGTEVLFNKAFKDVNSITLTTASIEPLVAVYNFTDVPNPTGFKILVFDTAGNRINYLVSWKARGVV
jgi:hypothetical protein